MKTSNNCSMHNKKLNSRMFFSFFLLYFDAKHETQFHSEFGIQRPIHKDVENVLRIKCELNEKIHNHWHFQIDRVIQQAGQVDRKVENKESDTQRNDDQREADVPPQSSLRAPRAPRARRAGSVQERREHRQPGPAAGRGPCVSNHVRIRLGISLSRSAADETRKFEHGPRS